MTQVTWCRLNELTSALSSSVTTNLFCSLFSDAVSPYVAEEVSERKCSEVTLLSTMTRIVTGLGNHIYVNFRVITYLAYLGTA
jgi:hypothetical protein